MSDHANDRKHAGASTSRSLIVRLQDDDAQAWNDLIQLYSPLILYWCRKQGANDRDCEDILQDVLRTVVGNIEKFRKDSVSSTFRGWLRTLTRSRLADFYRKRSDDPVAAGGTDAQMRLLQVPHLVHEANDSDPEEAALEERQLFLRAIELIRNEFQPLTWQAFWRTTVDGCSAKEVGEELGMRPGTVRVARSRVLRRLRDRLGDP